MQLYFSYTSPFARKVRATIIEKGLEGHVTMIEAVPYENPPALLAANPLGKIPALILDNGLNVIESALICEVLDSLRPETQLIPHSGLERISVLRTAAFGQGLADVAVALLMESRREPQLRSQAQQTRLTDQLRRTVDFLESEATHWPLKSEGPVHFGDLAVATSLGYVDFRHGALNWRDGHPKLAAWYAAIAQRRSMRETAPPSA